MKRRRFLHLTTAAMIAPCLSRAQAAAPPAAVVHDAFIYLYPMVQNYLSIYQWAIDSLNSQYKGPFNQVNNVARVFTPADTGVITPNSDTPYSYLIMDLRAEPIIVTLPGIEADRYYSLQVADLYTHNVAYPGTREDGNAGGDFLIAGPDWQGAAPAGITRVIRIPTTIAFSQFRTQLKSPGDIGRVKDIQAGYKAQPLSAYAGTAAPPAAPAIDWPEITPESQIPEFWTYANFLLQFAPALPWEAELRASFATIGVAPAPKWPATPLDPAVQDAVLASVPGSYKELIAAVQRLTTSAGLFGTPEAMKGKYLERALGALGGIYGNSDFEALYPTFMVDADGTPMDSTTNRYTMRLKAGEQPPAGAFWSITMYHADSKFLVENPINRYLVNSAMLPDLKTEANGDIVLYLQHESPGPDLESNWLPAPEGPMAVVMRLYLPKPEALDGRWVPQPIRKRT